MINVAHLVPQFSSEPTSLNLTAGGGDVIGFRKSAFSSSYSKANGSNRTSVQFWFILRISPDGSVRAGAPPRPPGWMFLPLQSGVMASNRAAGKLRATFVTLWPSGRRARTTSQVRRLQSVPLSRAGGRAGGEGRRSAGPVGGSHVTPRKTKAGGFRRGFESETKEPRNNCGPTAPKAPPTPHKEPLISFQAAPSSAGGGAREAAN